MTSRYFTPSHEWIEVKGKVATVGITDFAQKELGEIVYVQLPKPHTHLKAGQEAAVLESTKAASDVYAPVTGTILATNPAVSQNPSLINQHAQTSGWLFQLSLDQPADLDHLLTQAQYTALT